MIFRALEYVLLMAFTVYLGRQVKIPSRFLGRVFARMMNKSHSALTDWALSHLAIEEGSKILDVGCGGGKTIEKLAKAATLVCGIDYAAGSIAESMSHNKELIAKGRVHVERASVSSLPFTANFF